MRVASQRRSETAMRCLLLLGGAAIGLLLSPALWKSPTATSEPATSPRGLPATPPPASAPVAPGDLDLLQLSITPADLAHLDQQRQVALAAGILVQDRNYIVPVQVRVGDAISSGTARLKGDWTDHLDSGQWSLRLELTAPIRGMRKFSIQHPKTRGHTMEWFVMQTARRIGLLTPRTDFVHVELNGERKGVYYLEEHASKELLESQARREGSIVRFDESSRWGTILQYGFHRTGLLAKDIRRTQWVLDAEVAGYDEKRLLGSSQLAARLLRAIDLARDVQRSIVAAGPQASPARQMLALRRLEGRTVEDIFDVDALGRWLAVHTLFRAFHGMVWIQWRFYHDPQRDRLEPIVFDTGADLLQHVGELVLDSPEIRWLRGSDAAMVAAWRAIGKLTEPAFLDRLLADLLPQIRRYEQAMLAAGSGEPGLDLAASLASLLRLQAAWLRESGSPRHAAAFQSTLIGARLPNGEDLRAIEVEAWARTGIATTLTGFEFSNGRVVPAAEALVGVSTVPDSADVVTILDDGAVVLPPDGQRLRFRFAADRRLLDLGEVAALKRALRRQLTPQARETVEITALFRPAAESVDRRERLSIRRSPLPETKTEGRPAAPDLATALAQHPFLEYDLETRRLHAAPGFHVVTGDLLLPSGLALHLPAGCVLQFDADKVAVVGALVASGTAQNPVVLQPSDPAAGWAGLLVLGSAGDSRLQHLQCSGASEINRGGWQCSGGVTFLDRRVEMYDCEFRDGRGEDLVNLFGARIHLERCRFHGGKSDLLDGDFVTGSVIDCSFADAVEDGIDVSGSVLQVRGCRFERIGDKAISIGENSQLEADDCSVTAAAIAVAAKDRSHGIVRRLRVLAVDHFVAAVYVKKPEFGPASMELHELDWRGSGAPRHLVQEGNQLLVDGKPLPGVPVDVDALYRAKILGK